MGIRNMSPCELAEWMRAEQDALRELNRLIRQHIASMPDVNLADWSLGLKAAFERLRVHIERDFAAKEEGGYLCVVTDLRPSLSRQVEGIRSEHEQILMLANRILADIAETTPEQRLLLDSICARIERFLTCVEEHDRREVMITLAVCSQDIGGKG